MRISDWSSDVCSSDLDLQSLDDLLWLQLGLRFSQILQQNFALALKVEIDQHLLDGFRTDAGREGVFAIFVLHLNQFIFSQKLIRSEEHTSELQSLMRISYAVFCLKKKNKEQ